MVPKSDHVTITKKWKFAYRHT